MLPQAHAIPVLFQFSLDSSPVISTPKLSCKHVTTIAAKPHPKSACLLQRSLGRLAHTLSNRLVVGVDLPLRDEAVPYHRVPRSWSLPSIRWLHLLIAGVRSPGRTEKRDLNPICERVSDFNVIVGHHLEILTPSLSHGLPAYYDRSQRIDESMVRCQEDGKALDVVGVDLVDEALDCFCRTHLLALCLTPKLSSKPSFGRVE